MGRSLLASGTERAHIGTTALIAAESGERNARRHGRVLSMTWLRSALRGSFDPDEEIAERLLTVRRFPPRVVRETAPLSEEATVQRWARSLRTEDDVQVHVRRHWGVLAVTTDRKNPISVVLQDSSHSWVAEPPDAGGRGDLTLDQVERIVLEALSADQRPACQEWEAVNGGRKLTPLRRLKIDPLAS